MKVRRNLDEWLSLLIDEIPVEMASVMFLVAETNELEIFGAVGFDSPPDLVLPAGVGIAGWVIDKGEPEIVNDVAVDPRFEADDHNTRQLLVYPLMGLSGQVVGVINLSNPLETDKFRKKHLDKIAEFLEENPIDYRHYVLDNFS